MKKPIPEADPEKGAVMRFKRSLSALVVAVLLLLLLVYAVWDFLWINVVHRDTIE